MAGVTPVTRSHCRVWLLRKMLSLYSSDTLIEGVSVTPPRWGGGARSPNSSSGYAAGGGPGLGAVGEGPGSGGCSRGPPGRGSWPHAWAAMRQTVRPTVAPTPTLTRQSQPSTDLLTRVNEACRPDLHRNRAPTLVHRTVMPDYRADRGFLRLFIGDAQGIGVRTNSVVPDYLGDTAFSRHCRFQRG